MKELANYCLGCINKPCSKGCPLNNDISEFDVTICGMIAQFLGKYVED